MTDFNILSVTAGLGGFVFFFAVSFALTTGVLRECLLMNALHTEGAKSVRLDPHTPSP